MPRHLVTAQIVVWANTWQDAEEIVLRMDKHHELAYVSAAKWEEELETEDDDDV